MLGVFSTQANAASYSWIHNQRASTTCLSWYPGYNGRCYDIMPNGTKFAMNCWTTHYGFNGNYWSNRWFYGQSYRNGSWGWVHSSYVYYQKSVRHC